MSDSICFDTLKVTYNIHAPDIPQLCLFLLILLLLLLFLFLLLLLLLFLLLLLLLHILLLQENGDKYGQQRVWGSIGWGIFTVVAGGTGWLFFSLSDHDLQKVLNASRPL